MAGGHHFPYPKWVWSPAGGWWAKPKHWKRDTVIFYVVAGTMLYGAYQFCEARTVGFIFSMLCD